MVQELISNKRIAIVGAGPSGCICAKHLSDYGVSISLFDYGKPLRTILPTGGGRCNLAHAIYDFKELAKNYPRGEKFLYSVFSRYSTDETLKFFKSIGIETYTQDDNRIFPKSNSSKDVQNAILKSLKKVQITNEKVTCIEKLDNGFKLSTEKSKYLYDYIVIALGGHSDFSLLKNLGINIIEPTQALVALKTKTNYSDISGVSIKNIQTKIKKQTLTGDILFTHKGVSGPLIYKLSSIFARNEIPYTIEFKLIDNVSFQELLDKNSKKEIKNLLSQFLPKSFVQFYLKQIQIDEELPCHKINGKLRELIFNNLLNYKIEVIGKVADSEVVTCGGVDLKEVNSKDLQHKTVKNLYFCGEVLDIDGFCGGFNLQNCWSTGYVVANSIYQSLIG